jgi:hypothetical protein
MARSKVRRTGSDSTTGGLEAAVLDGGGGVIMKEGHGLGETDETTMVVGRKADALWRRVVGRV